MKETHKYKVNEIFYSLQGEGAYTGTPAVFVRFSGCNRKCVFCDTDFSSYIEMTASEILTKVKNVGHDCNLIVFTGGEPLMQLDEELLILAHSKGYEVHLETNGTLPVPDGVDWVTCSPKTESLGIQPDKIDEIKVVYTGQSDLVLEEIQKRFFSAKFFFLQPCSGKNIKETIEKVLQMPSWRLSLQTHKLLNIP